MAASEVISNVERNTTR